MYQSERERERERTHLLLLCVVPVGSVHAVVQPAGVAEVLALGVPAPQWGGGGPTVAAVAVGVVGEGA